MTPAKSRMLARIALEEFLDTKLPPEVIVHHKDENPLNNSIQNLEMVTRADHAKIHSGKDQRYNRKETEGKILPKGVYYAPDGGRGKWMANIRYNGGRISSRHRTLEAAIAWRQAKELELWGDK